MARHGGERGGLTGVDAGLEDAYAILKVDRQAADSEVRAAYLSLVSCLHPDKTGLASARTLAEVLSENDSANTSGGGGSNSDGNGAAHGSDNGDGDVNGSRRLDALLRDLRLKAEAQFCLIDRAYRILSDPAKRKAYDEYGLTGVRVVEADEMARKQVAFHVDQPAQVRAMLRTILKEEREAELEATFPSAGDMLVFCRMLPLRENDGTFRPDRLLPHAEQMTVQQRVVMTLSPSTELKFSGFVLSRRKGLGGFYRGGQGFGATSCAIHHKVDERWWIGTEAQVMHDPYVALSSGRALTDSISATCQLIFAEGGPKLRVGTACVGVPVLGTTHATMNISPTKGMGMGVKAWRGVGKGPAPKGRVNCEVNMMPNDLSCRGGYQYTLNEKSRADVELKLGTSGVEVQVNHRRVLGRACSSRCGIKLGLDGVSAMIRFKRGDMSLQLPILLHRSFDPVAVLVGALVPMLVDGLVHSLTRPGRLEKEIQQSVEASVRRRKRLSKARANASMQVHLMVHMATVKANREDSIGGLVILVARYGRKLHVDYGARWWAQSATSNSGRSSSGGTSRTAGGGGSMSGLDGNDTSLLVNDRDVPQNIDVTVPLQFFVSESTLRLPASSKAGLLGFYRLDDDDDDEGYMRWSNTMKRRRSTIRRLLSEDGEQLLPEPLQLYIRYRLRGQLYELTVHDLDGVVLPCARADHLGPSSFLR